MDHELFELVEMSGRAEELLEEDSSLANAILAVLERLDEDLMYNVTIFANKNGNVIISIKI